MCKYMINKELLRHSDAFSTSVRSCVRGFVAAAALVLGLFSADAQQSPLTVHGFVAGGMTENNVYIAIGQPFYRQYHNGEVEISEGVAQAQLVTKEIEAGICQDGVYAENYFELDGLAPGTYQFENYQTNVDTLWGYDLLNKLTLNVYEIYNMEDARMYHADVLPVVPGNLLKGGEDVQLEEGMNELTYLSVHGCDSLVRLFVTICPLTVLDADNHQYNTVVMNDFYCWTRENLQTENYSACEGAGSHASGGYVNNRIYKSMLYPDVAANLSIYGRLYSWDDAVGNHAVGDYVQGICPCGWHIPTAEEAALFATYSSEEVNSTEHWLDPNNNINSTGFTMLPGGFYNSVTQQYEGLRTVAGFWTDVNPQGSASTALMIPYFCDTPGAEARNAGDALSVRCVKDNLSRE